MDGWCNGESLVTTWYTTIEAAEADCSNSPDCGCIYDDLCQGERWTTHKGPEILTGTCSWTKSKLTFPFHTKKIMYFATTKPMVQLFLYLVVSF